MQPPKILIVGRCKDTLNYERALHYMNVHYATSLVANHFPYYDGLLLPGGGDISPSLFGQINQGSKNIDLELDLIQLRALDFFLKERKPVLGICKGMQLINIGLGGTLIQHLPEAASHAWQGTDSFHSTYLVKDCLLEHIYKRDRLVTNSAHHQSVHLLGEKLRLIQWAKDGVPEGIIHSSLPILGLQWHPERQIKALQSYTHYPKDLADGSLIFSYFLSLCQDFQ